MEEAGRRTEEVRLGTLAYVTEDHLILLRLAFQYVLDEFEIEHRHTVAYTSNNIAIEYVWSDVKGFAKRAENQRIGRTPAEAINLMRDKLFKPVCIKGVMQPPVSMSKWFDHCEHEWKGWILQDAKNGGPLSGTIRDLIGAPIENSEEWKVWLLKAGDGEAGDVGDDLEFEGDEGEEQLFVDETAVDG